MQTEIRWRPRGLATEKSRVFLLQTSLLLPGFDTIKRNSLSVAKNEKKREKKAAYVEGSFLNKNIICNGSLLSSQHLLLVACSPIVSSLYSLFVERRVVAAKAKIRESGENTQHKDRDQKSICRPREQPEDKEGLDSAIRQGRKCGKIGQMWLFLYTRAWW